MEKTNSVLSGGGDTSVQETHLNIIKINTDTEEILWNLH